MAVYCFPTEGTGKQNAADAASLAGGGAATQYLEANNIHYSNWNCSGNVINAMNIAENTAISRASSNDVVIDYDLSDQNGVDAQCSSYPKKYIDVITQVAAETRTSFAHLLFDQPLEQTVEAVTRVYARLPFGSGNAIVALNEEVCDLGTNGATFTGDSEVHLTGGGVLSNGCLTGEGNALIVDVNSGEVTYGEENQVTHPEKFTPSPQPGMPINPDTFDVFPEPNCSAVPDLGDFQTGGSQPLWELEPGRYTNITVEHPTVMKSGLYCLTGDFVIAGNGTLGVDPYNGINGVTIYLISGGFSTQGSNEVNIYAPPVSPNPSPAIPDVLIFMAPGNTNQVILTGNSSSTYTGIVYAPDGDIEARGSEVGIGFNTALVGNNVYVRGEAYMEISYFQSPQNGTPTFLELHK